eukprot:7939914-Pyramimonas_sp.AAC.1
MSISLASPAPASALPPNTSASVRSTSDWVASDEHGGVGGGQGAGRVKAAVGAEVERLLRLLAQVIGSQAMSMEVWAAGKELAGAKLRAAQKLRDSSAAGAAARAEYLSRLRAQVWGPKQNDERNKHVLQELIGRLYLSMSQKSAH